MGLVLMPSEIKNSAKQVRANIAGNRDGYNSAMQVIQNFTGNDALKSESWDAAKSRIFDAHQSIVRGMAAVQDSIESDLDVLEASAGEEDLLEDELIKKIKELEEECIRYETMIGRLKRIVRSNMPIKSIESAGQLLKQYRALLENTKRELEIIRNKLQILYQKADKTSVLFQTIGTLLGAVENAINDAGVYISGTGTISDGSWRVEIPKCVQELEKKKEEKPLRDYMKDELGIALDDFREMYGEDMVKEIREYIGANCVDGILDENKEELNRFIIEKACDCSYVSVENGMYQLLGVNKNLMFEFEKDEIKDVVLNMAFANKETKKQYIADYLKRELDGITDVQVAAIMGNMEAESGFSPLISEKDHTDLYQPEYIQTYDPEKGNDKKGWGLIQWTYSSRKKGLYEYARDEKGNISYFGDMDTQLEYLVKELTEKGGACSNQYKTFLTYNDIEKATVYFRESIEIAKSGGDDTRVQNAENIYKELFDNSSSEKE